MPARLSKEARSELMSRVKTAGTGPEVTLRHALWKLGFRYRVNVRSLPGSPDIILPRYGTAIFVNGCFWHGHPRCKDYVLPKTNTDFWIEKVRKNRDRDERAWRALLAKGWEVVVVWECELSKERLDDTVSSVVDTIRANGVAMRTRENSRKEENRRYRCERSNRLKSSAERDSGQSPS